MSVADLLVLAGFAKSKSEARRLIDAGSVAIGDNKVANGFAPIPEDAGNEFVLHKGKKNHIKIILK
jgi:tyrosyl-tRNA synthetase